MQTSYIYSSKAQRKPGQVGRYSDEATVRRDEKSLFASRQRQITSG